MASPSPKRRGPKAVSDILAELFAAKGLARLGAAKALEDAWNAAVGEPRCRLTKLGEVRRGVLNVTVAHSALLEELAAFEKPKLLKALRENVPDLAVLDIRLRVGPVLITPAEPKKAETPPRRPPGGNGNGNRNGKRTEEGS